MSGPRSIYLVVRSVLTVSFLSAALWAALISVASAETITAFDVDMRVYADGKIKVTEEIVYDFGSANRHGIYRDIKSTHQQEASAWYKDRYVELDLISVERDGMSEPYALQEYDGLSVKIGDPNKTISGLHEYKIVYEMTGAMSVHSSFVELYWNVTGDEWAVPVQNVTVQITPEARGVAFGDQQACYVGAYGGTDSCTDMIVSFTGARFTQDQLPAYTGLTIGQSIVLPGAPTVLEKTNLLVLIPLLVLTWFIGLGTYLYRWRTAHRIDQTVVAQYEPYQDFRPMFTGVLLDNRLDPRDITAGIIYLAQQGFISIKQTTDKVLWVFETNDYEITLLKPKSEANKAYQKELISLLFHKPINLFQQLKKNLGLLSDEKSFGLSSDVAVEDNEQEVTSVKLSELKNNKVAARANYKTVQALKAAVKNDLVQRGFLEKKVHKYLFILPIVFIVLLVFADTIPKFLGELSVFVFVAVGVLFVSSLVTFGFGASRRTTKGYEALNHLEGFKEFLSVTEKERYQFHNAPHKSPQQFMEYLPYAIAFGVEKEWAEVFKDIDVGTPDWYSSDVAGAHFTAAAFTSDIGSFATALAGTASSGSSGSGGGGFSGGGGGGGGGGSW